MLGVVPRVSRVKQRLLLKCTPTFCAICATTRYELHLQECWRRSRLGICKGAEEILCLRRPSAPNFTGEHHKPGPSSRPHEFGASSFLSGACFLQSNSSSVTRTSCWHAITTQCGHQRCVNGQLDSPNSGNPSAMTSSLLPSR